MRAILILLAAAFFLSSAAYAGDVTIANGQVTWKSTKCTPPVVPPSLLDLNRETPADNVNALVGQYNEYSKAVHTYMNCLSDEAKTDADMVSQAIVASAQASLNETSKSVDIMGATLKKK